MTIDITSFRNINVIDCCAVWNVLSSATFYARSLEINCHFSMTKYVEYECLRKPRKSESKEESELKSTLVKEMNKGRFNSFPLSIQDLQDSEIASSRKKLGLGEVSSIAFAKKISHAFLTDDRAARLFATNLLGKDRVQTTPQLFGHLVYKRMILDSEVAQIIIDHKRVGRPLEPYLKEASTEALRILLMTSNQPNLTL